MNSIAEESHNNFHFEVLAAAKQARAGLLRTPHGVIETPVFMPVGTHSTVKTMTWQQVEGTGAQIVLSNAYHLFLRPGHALVEKAGGLHNWMHWKKPILTDSGGFQVFSLAKLRRVTEEGVYFQDPSNGNRHFIGPETSMQIQNALGADIIMAFDECPPYPVDFATAAASLERTQRWLERCFNAHQKSQAQALFPIVQGSTFETLRQKAAEQVQQFNAAGYAIGGVSVGEPRPLIHAITHFTAPLLPWLKPRYLMGVGTVADLLEAIAAGIDMFDCVLPTRNARHGTFFTHNGQASIKNSQFTEDFLPLVADCTCYTCQNHSRAYVRHLYRQGESTAKTLLSIHNTTFLINWVKQARQAILDGSFDDFYHNQKALQATSQKNG